MKTSSLNTTGIASHSQMQLHTLMVVAGIMTAVVCSLVLLKDVNTLQHMPF